MDDVGLLWLMAHSTQSVFHLDHTWVLLLLLVLDSIICTIIEDGRATSHSLRPTIEVRLRSEANTGLRPACFHNCCSLGLFADSTTREAIASRAGHLLMWLTWSSKLWSMYLHLLMLVAKVQSSAALPTLIESSIKDKGVLTVNFGV